MRGIRREAGGMLAVLVMSACAANPGADGAAGGEDDVFVHVVVENERAIPEFLQVYLVPPSGAEISLGTTSTLGTDTLVVRSAALRPGRYSLRAQAGNLRRVPSQNVQLRGGDTLYWNLRTRILRQSP